MCTCFLSIRKWRSCKNRDIGKCRPSQELLPNKFQHAPHGTSRHAVLLLPCFRCRSTRASCNEFNYIVLKSDACSRLFPCSSIYYISFCVNFKAKRITINICFFLLLLSARWVRLFQFAALIVRSGARTFKKVECVGTQMLFGSMKNVNLWQNAMRRVGANECIYSLRDCIGALDSVW